MAENQVQSEKKMTSLNVSSETRDAIKDISTSLGLSQADTVARLVDGYHPNATPGVKAALDASAVLDEAVERVKRIIVGAAEAAAMEARAAREDADTAKKSAMEQIQSIKSNCVEQVAAIKEKFELDTASLEIENDELHATVADYLSQLKKLDSENNQLLAESAAKDDRQTAVQVADSDNAQEDGVYGKMEYSVTGVEVHDSSADDGGKVAVVRWHAINNRSADSCAVGSYITAYQNKQMLSRGFAADLQEDRFSSQGLAPGGECDGVSIFDLNDMSPIEVKIDGMGAGSNSLDQTFELE